MSTVKKSRKVVIRRRDFQGTSKPAAKICRLDAMIQKIFSRTIFTGSDDSAKWQTTTAHHSSVTASVRRMDCRLISLPVSFSSNPETFTRILYNNEEYLVVGSLVDEISNRIKRGGIYHRTAVFQLVIDSDGTKTRLLARERVSLSRACNRILSQDEIEQLSTVRYTSNVPSSIGAMADYYTHLDGQSILFLESQALNHLQAGNTGYLFRGINKFDILGLINTNDFVQSHDFSASVATMAVNICMHTISRPPIDQLAAYLYTEQLLEIRKALCMSPDLETLRFRLYDLSLFHVSSDEMKEEVCRIFGVNMIDILYSLRAVDGRGLVQSCDLENKVKQALLVESYHSTTEQFLVLEELSPFIRNRAMEGFNSIHTLNQRCQELAEILSQTNSLDIHWTPNMLQDRFQLRQTIKGGWVTNGEYLLAVQLLGEGLMDLEGVLGKTMPALLGMEGLALSYGARGRGKASAHFESDEFIINLTRFRGIGSLAHEFGHYLDCSLGRYFSNTLKTLKRKQSFESSTRYGLSMFAKGSIGSYWRYLPKQLQALFECMEELFPIIQLQSVIALRPATQVYGVQSCLTMGKTSGFTGGSGYYLRKNEIFARSFEVWVEEKLKTNGVSNLCLVDFTGEGSVYPQGKSRENLVAAMDTFMERVEGVLYA